MVVEHLERAREDHVAPVENLDALPFGLGMHATTRDIMQCAGTVAAVRENRWRKDFLGPDANCAVIRGSRRVTVNPDLLSKLV